MFTLWNVGVSLFRTKGNALATLFFTRVTNALFLSLGVFMFSALDGWESWNALIQMKMFSKMISLSLSSVLVSVSLVYVCLREYCGFSLILVSSLHQILVVFLGGCILPLSVLFHFPQDLP